MLSAKRFRAIALAFEGAIEVPHFDRSAFRTKRRIFATLAADGATANLMLDPDAQGVVCEALPACFAPVPGGWGRMGATTVDLSAVSEADVVRALTEAYARASAPKTKQASKAPRSSHRRRARRT